MHSNDEIERTLKEFKKEQSANDFLKKLNVLLLSVDVKLDEELFIKQLTQIGLLNKQQDILQRIELLVYLVAQTQGDFDAKRDAYHLLKHIHDSETLCYLLDAKDYLSTLLKDKLGSEYDRLVACLKACMVDAKQIAESLFTDIVNPAAHGYMLSYTICSKNIHWVKQLVEIWHVDITQEKYCFRLYAERLGLEELVKFYQDKIKEKQENKNTFFSSTNAQNKVTTSLKIPPELLQIAADGLSGIWETMQEFSDVGQKLIFAVLKNKDLSPEQATRVIRQIEINEGLPEVLSSSFDVLFCARHLKKWDEIKNTEHKRNFIDNMAKIALECDATPANRKLAEDQLKVHAYKQVSKLLAETSNGSLSLSEEEKSKYLALLTTASNQLETVREVPGTGKCYEKSFIDDYLQESHLLDNNVVKSSDFNIISCKSSEKVLAPSIGAHNKLNKNAEAWQKIYELIKYPPIIRIQRDENKMLAVIKAILYKHETNCKWVDLPKWAPSVGQVYYYYSEAKRRDLLDKIITLSTNANNHSIKPGL